MKIKKYYSVMQKSKSKNKVFLLKNQDLTNCREKSLHSPVNGMIFQSLLELICFPVSAWIDSAKNPATLLPFGSEYRTTSSSCSMYRSTASAHSPSPSAQVWAPAGSTGQSRVPTVPHRPRYTSGFITWWIPFPETKTTYLGITNQSLINTDRNNFIKFCVV